MPNLLFIFMLFSAFCLSTEMALAKQRMEVEKDGKSFAVQAVKGSKLSYLALDSESGTKGGLYIFDERGKEVASRITEDAAFYEDVRLSPDGRYLAMDTGTFTLREWQVYHFPTMKPAVFFPYVTTEGPALVWAKDGALFTEIETVKHGRHCGYDPCGPQSVSFVSFRTQKQKRIFRGTDACDYTLEGYLHGQVDAKEICLHDWHRSSTKGKLVRKKI